MKRKTKKEVENAIRSIMCWDDTYYIKRVLLEILDIIQEPKDVVSYKDIDIELIDERISNIENCLTENDKKLDISSLRI